MAINRNGVFEATDQVSLDWLTGQTEKIEARVHDQVMKKIRWPELVQRYSDMEAGQNSLITYVSEPGSGQMTTLANGGEDLPMVEVTRGRTRREVYVEGLAYAFTDMEIAHAMQARVDLRSDKVKAAYRIANEYIERAVLTGNTEHGWTGLANHPTTGADACRHYSESTPWSTNDTTTPFETIRQAFNAVWAGSDQVESPDTLLLPSKALTFLTQMMKTSSGITSVSVWDFIRENNPYTKETGNPLMMKAIPELNTAGPSSAPRAVLYSSDIDAVRLVLPQELRFIAPQRVGFSQKFYGSMICGGLQVLRPKSMCIIDGIGNT